MERIPKTTSHIILYFDILGYKTLLKSKVINEQYIMHAIKNLITQVKKYSKDTKIYKSLIFSDNCVICFQIKKILSVPALLCHAVAIAQFIERNLLLHGLFVRGSICRGDIYINNNFIFGNGIIKAYELENEVAIYPRIIIDSELIEFTLQYIEIIKEGKLVDLQKEVIFPEHIDEKNMFTVLSELYGALSEDMLFYSSIKVCKDFDGQYFVDMLQNVFSEYSVNDIKQIDLTKKCIIDNCYYAISNNILYGTDKIKTPDINVCLCLICTRIINGFCDSINNPKVNAKYLWFCNYINRFYKDIGLKEPFSNVILRRLERL